MASMYDIKPAFQRSLLPACALLHGAGVTPNQLTITALTASAGMGLWLLLSNNPIPALLTMPAFLLLRMALNALDGMLARQYNLSTRAGAILNEVADVLADAALYLPFASLAGIRPAFPVAVAILGATTEVAGLASASTGVARRHDGPMGKSDRALAFGLLSIAYAAGLRNRTFLDSYMAAVVLLLLVTIANRCRRGARGIS